jgi:hypothetical protein
LRLVAGGWFVLREKYCWLVADKPSEQAGNVHPVLKIFSQGHRQLGNIKGSAAKSRVVFVLS